MTQEQLLTEMEGLLEAGDTKALETYVLEHFTELPEDVQGKVLLGFYSEALENEAGTAQIAGIQREGLQALEDLESMKKEASASTE